MKVYRLMKSWGEIKSYTLTPLCNMVERTLQKSCCWGFSGRRLRVSEPETLACKGRRLWLWTRDSGQRIRPPKLGFDPSCASLCCLPGVFEKGLRRLRGMCTKVRDSDPYKPETSGASQTRFSPKWCKPLLPPRSLWKRTPETLRSPETPALKGRRLWVTPETPALTGRRLRVTPETLDSKSGDSEVSRPPMARFLRGV
jgi:hypothetical protein